VSFAYTLPAPATVTATLVSPAGDALATLLSAAKPAGAQTLAFTPPPGLFNGRYALVLAAAAAGRTVTATIPFTIDDMLTGFAVTRASATFTLNRAPLGVTLQVTRGATVVAAPPVAAAIGAQTVAWPALPDGSYTVTLSVTDDIGTVIRSTSVVVDTTAPKVRVISYRRLRFAVSEPATLTLYVGSKRYVRTPKSAGVTQFRLRTRFSAYRMVARDAAGNTSVVRYRR